MAEQPTLYEVISAVADQQIEGVHVSTPALVVAYDASKQIADVQPVIKRRREDSSTGEVFYEQYPTIPNVRVRWPMGGGFGVTLPLAKGDYVELVFGHDPVSEFRANGGIVEPQDAERHGPSSPWAYPTSGPDSDVFAAASASKAVVGHATGARIEISATAIDAGPSGAFLAHSAEVLAALGAVQTAIGALTGILNTVSGLAAGLTPPTTPAKYSDITTVLAALAGAAAVSTTLAGALAAAEATLPTLTLKGK